MLQPFDISDSEDRTSAEVYAISKNIIFDPSSSEEEPVKLLNVPNEVPSCSHKKMNSKLDKYTEHILKQISSDSDGEVYVPKQSRRMMEGEKILSQMLINIHNEEKYLHCLKQLSVLEEIYKKHCSLPIEYTIEQIDYLPVPKTDRVKRSKPHSMSAENSNDKRLGRSDRSKNTLRHENTTQIILFGSLLDRTELRRQLLKNFQCHYADEESYGIFLGSLLDFEESLICM